MANDDRLDALLVAAGEAPPNTRIMFRDDIAVFGDDAIQRLSGEAWILDSHYAAFAIRTIQRAGELGPRQLAIDALRRSRPNVSSERLQADIDAALIALGAQTRQAARPRPAGERTHDVPAMAVEDLVAGSCYKRRDLHASGLGGSPQAGISYPRDGTHALLFSNPDKVSEYGYKDQPVGDRGYRYFGGWHGSGDMSMTGGNKAVVDRSPELYLLIQASCGYVYRGRFELLRWEIERAARDGREDQAIVFILQRAADR